MRRYLPVVLVIILLTAVIACGTEPTPPAPEPEPPSVADDLTLSPISTVGPPATLAVAAPTAAPTRDPDPTATPTPRPTLGTTLADLPAVIGSPTRYDASDRRRIALAYAYCNGLYFGDEAERRYQIVMSRMADGNRSENEVADDVAQFCSNNVDNPRMRLPRPTSTPLPTPTPDPRRDDASGTARRDHLLRLINEKRIAADLPLLRRSADPTAQEHADYNLRHCSAALWAQDGRSILRQYHQGGGVQNIAAWHRGYHRCIDQPPQPWPTWMAEARNIIDTLAQQPGSPLLDPQYSRVGIGVAWTPYQRWHTLIFESRRVQYQKTDPNDLLGGAPSKDPQELPQVGTQYAKVAAPLTGAAEEVDPASLIVRLYHLPPPTPLSRYRTENAPPAGPGALIAVAVAGSGADSSAAVTPNEPVCDAAMPVSEDYQRPQWVICQSRPITPYDLPEDGPRSLAHQTRAAESLMVPIPGPRNQVQLLLSRDLRVTEDDLLLASVNVRSLLQFHGPGIYTIEVWGAIDGTPRLIVSGSTRH